MPATWTTGWVLAPLVFLSLCALSLVWRWLAASGFDVRGKHVFISGGTKGVGLAIAKRYAAAGAKVSLVGRSMERLELAKIEIQRTANLGTNSTSRSPCAAPPPAAAATATTTVITDVNQSSCAPPQRRCDIFLAECDVSDLTQVERAVASANAFHSRVTDHVVHAAVTVSPGIAWTQDLAQMRREMAVSYFGAVHLFKSAAPAMLSAGVVGGSFVIVTAANALAHPVASSVSAFSGVLLGLRGLAESLRNEFYADGIAVSMLYAGEVSASRRGNGTSSGIETGVLPPMTANSPVPSPRTPRAGLDAIGTGFVGMSDEFFPASPVDPDAAAKSLVNGLRAGDFLITNSWSGFCYRVASAGFTPRKIQVLELVLGMLLVPYLEIRRVLQEFSNPAHPLREAPVASSGR